MDKPFSQSCENNKASILDVLQRVFANTEKVLEIGSGTGQHAVYFTPRMPQLVWQTSDLRENLVGINAWLEEFPSPNLIRPIEIDVADKHWPTEKVDGIFSANTCHIMSWENVKNLFSGLETILSEKSVVAIYGPFNYGGKFTSPSNKKFDAWLKQKVPHQGLRDVEKINELAEQLGLKLIEDNAMPANNRLLVWKR